MLESSPLSLWLEEACTQQQSPSIAKNEQKQNLKPQVNRVQDLFVVPFVASAWGCIVKIFVVLVRFFRKNGTNRRYLICAQKMRKWLMQLWKLRNSTTLIAVCKLETQKSQWCNSLESEGSRTRGANGLNPSPGTEEDEMRCTNKKKGLILPSSTFCSFKALKGLNDVHLHYWVHWFKC